MKRRLYELLEHEPPLSSRARVVRAFILALILVSIAGLVLESVASIRLVAGPTLYILEVITVLVFSAEYLVRLWTITEDPRYAHPVRGRLRWVTSPLALLDLLAIVPFYLPFIVADLRVLRLARVFRLFRVLKLARYSIALQLIAESARDKREELLVTLGFILMLLLFAASLMYYAEHDAQPEVFASIPASMWWAIVTLTTVGYGDTYPITAWGRVLAAATAVLGIAMLALPTAILSAGFTERMQKRKAMNAGRCPHCGEAIV